MGIIDEDGRRVWKKKLRNDPSLISESLSPFKRDIEGICRGVDLKDTSIQRNEGPLRYLLRKRGHLVRLRKLLYAILFFLDRFNTYQMGVGVLNRASHK